MAGFNTVIGVTVDKGSLNNALGTITKTVQTQINSMNGKLTKTVETWVKTIDNGDGTLTKFNKTLVSYKNATNQATNAQGKLVKEGSKYITKQEASTKAVKTNTSAIKTNTSALSNNADTVKNSTSVLDNFVTTITKVAYFKIANEALQLFSEACTEAKEAILDLDEAITEFNKVSDLSEDGSLQDYITELGELGETVARTQSEMLSSSTQFVKSGYSEEDAKTLAQVNSLLQNVADSELTTEEAANILISTMKAFNIEGQDAITVVDALNEVKLFVTSLNRVNCGENPMMFVSYNVI